MVQMLTVACEGNSRSDQTEHVTVDVFIPLLVFNSCGRVCANSEIRNHLIYTKTAHVRSLANTDQTHCDTFHQ